MAISSVLHDSRLKNLVDTTLHRKLDFRSLSPPPNFDMRGMQHELRRLGQEQSVMHDKLRDQQAQVDAVESFTPVIREYSAYAVRKADIDCSALLPPVVDSSTTLSQRLAALEEITQRLQQDEQANGPVLQQVQQLETTVWLQEERINGATGRMDRIEEYAHTRWKETQEELRARQRDLVEIRSEQERLEAEVKDAIKTLERKWEATPGALEERLTESIGKLTGRVETVEQMINALTNSVTVVSEHNLKLSARQSTLEQLIIKYLGKRERLDVQIDATPGTVNFGPTLSAQDRPHSTRLRQPSTHKYPRARPSFSCPRPQHFPTAPDRPLHTWVVAGSLRG